MQETFLCLPPSSDQPRHPQPPTLSVWLKNLFHNNRWTLEEGVLEAADNGDGGGGAPATTVAPPAPAAAKAAALAGATPADDGSRSEQADAPATAEGGAPASVTAVVPPGEDRWAMNDGAADLTERGVELEMGGAGLPSPSSSSSSPPFLLGAEGGGGRSRRRGRKRNRQEWTEEAKAEVGVGLDCCVAAASWVVHPRHQPYHHIALRRGRKPYNFLKQKLECLALRRRQGSGVEGRAPRRVLPTVYSFLGE